MKKYASKDVLSLFDGISCLQVALKRLGVKYKNYYGSEIEEDAKKIAKKRFPNMTHIGDVRLVKGEDYKNVFLITAGSPCQQFSLAGTRKGMVDYLGNQITSLKQFMKLKKQGYKFDENSQSYLFWEFVRILREIQKVNPKVYFILENVKMSRMWLHIISSELGVLPIMINSSTVSGQNRERYYWTNIPNVSQPKDKNITLSKLFPGVKTGYGFRGVDKGKRKPNGDILWEQNGTARVDFKANCITTKKSSTAKFLLKNGKIRDITISEAEVLQTLPKNYTKVAGVSETKRWKAVGNGWTINVITHILRGIK